MKITIVGAGYVGLVTAAIYSEFGNDVFCVDISKDRIEKLKKGIVPFFEPNLEAYIKRGYKENRLHFTTSYQESVSRSDLVFICVGTPPGKDGEADLTYLFAAIEKTAKNLSKNTLIVIKSTYPIGFEDDLESIVKKFTKHDFEFASCPEFLKEGTAIEDSLNPDRIVIGTNSKKAQDTLLELHAPLPGKRIICDMRSAQIIKYASNSFLALKVSYANALAIICEKTGANIEKVLEGVGADTRIGSSYFKPGIGYGGSCLPKDINAFIAQAQRFDYNFDLLKSVDSINNGQIEKFITKIRIALDATDDKKVNLEGFKLAILGLSFKPNTDDMRDAPSIKIIQELTNLKAQITACDPEAIKVAKKIFPNINYTEDVYEAVEGKDAMIIVTDWLQFKEMNLKRIKNLMRKPIIIDGRNIFDIDNVKNMGFKYLGI